MNLSKFEEYWIENISKGEVLSISRRLVIQSCTANGDISCVEARWWGIEANSNIENSENVRL